MPGYIEKVLHKFQYTPLTPQYSPHDYHRRKYYTTLQYACMPDESHFTTQKEIQRIQLVTGTFLYDRRAIDLTMMVAPNDIEAVQAKPTQNPLNNYN